MSNVRKWLLNGIAALSLLLSIAVAGLGARSRTYCDCVNFYPKSPPTDLFLIDYAAKCFSISSVPNVVDLSWGVKSGNWGTSLNKVEKGFSYRCEKRGEYLTIPPSW